MKNVLVIFLLFFYSTISYCQNLFVNDPVYKSLYEKELYNPDYNFHQSFKPIYNNRSLKNNAFDTINYKLLYSNEDYSSFMVDNTYIIRLGVSNKNYKLVVKPLLDISAGTDMLSTSNSFKNIGFGFAANFNYKTKLNFNLNYTYNEATFPDYIDSVISKIKSIPGYGYAFGNSKNYYFNQLNFQLRYDINKYFSLDAGKDKHFIGNGYRSLLMSDNSSSNPYLRITSTFWKIKYTNLFLNAKYIDSQNKIRDKFLATHYVSYNITKKLNFSFYEVVVFKSQDSNDYRGFDINYLNPVIFYRPVENSLGSPDNVLLGCDISYKFSKSFVAYIQVMLDEFKIKEIRARNGWWANKQAAQAGFKYFDAFTVKNLNLNGEFNYVRPFTYSHEYPIQNYANFNQPIAHPLGANFYEALGIASYRYKKFIFEGKAIYAKVGYDLKNLDYGQNININYLNHVSEYGNFTTQGLTTNLVWANLNVYYLLKNTKTYLIMGINNRYQSNINGRKVNSFIYFGISNIIGKQMLDI